MEKDLSLDSVTDNDSKRMSLFHELPFADANGQPSTIDRECSGEEIRRLLKLDLWGSGAMIRLRNDMEARLKENRGLVEPWAQTAWVWGGRCIATRRDSRSTTMNNADASPPIAQPAAATASTRTEGVARQATILCADLTRFALPTDLALSVAQLELRREELMAVLRKELKDVEEALKIHAERMGTMAEIIATLNQAILQREVGAVETTGGFDDGTGMLSGGGSDQDGGIQDLEKRYGGFQDVVEEGVDFEPLLQWGIKGRHVGIFD